MTSIPQKKKSRRNKLLLVNNHIHMRCTVLSGTATLRFRKAKLTQNGIKHFNLTFPVILTPQKDQAPDFPVGQQPGRIKILVWKITLLRCTLWNYQALNLSSRQKLPQKWQRVCYFQLPPFHIWRRDERIPWKYNYHCQCYITLWLRLWISHEWAILELSWISSSVCSSITTQRKQTWVVLCSFWDSIWCAWDIYVQ